MITMSYTEAPTNELRAILNIRDLLKTSVPLYMIKSNVQALLEDIAEDYNFTESAINSLKEIMNQRTFKKAEFHLHNAFHAQMQSETEQETCSTQEIELQSTQQQSEVTIMDMSQIETDALMAKTTDTERKLILLKLMQSKTAIKNLLAGSHFEDITRMHKLFNEVYGELKKEHEEEEKRKKEEANKRKLDQAFEALDVDSIDLTPEQIIERLAAKLGVKTNIKKKEDKAKKGKGTRSISTFVLKCTDDEGTEYRERNTSGQAGQLAKYCVDGKSLTDFIIGKLLKDEHEGYYTNMNSKHEIIDATELKEYLASVNKQDKFIDASTLQNENSSESNPTSQDDEAAIALAALNQNL
ncbi:hypothetical protein [Photobacterium damselae]|uniref:hypothetical protein n=1 Tax=Photobacterium damselae TaxID=38293 RepID=UPI00165D4C42|nr:hypothetical protein [Photobacterium damselae]